MCGGRIQQEGEKRGWQSLPKGTVAVEMARNKKGNRDERGRSVYEIEVDRKSDEAEYTDGRPEVEDVRPTRPWWQGEEIGGVNLIEVDRKERICVYDE